MKPPKKELNKKEREAQEAQRAQEVSRTRMPNKNEGELLGIVIQRMGAAQILVMTEEGKEMNCRIPGKMIKRIWMRPNDVVIIKKWDFQPSKADVTWRYTEAQGDYLRRSGHLNSILEKKDNPA
ncbi:MAG: translation initiation factor eIF-1A [Candidatus Diapherotrites archaeon]|nr:translation initiation factor eIF-1A [Candidatus Diapherotrites archaeon]